jgi:hypothetical protein
MPGLQWITGLAAAIGTDFHFQSKIFINQLERLIMKILRFMSNV